MTLFPVFVDVNRMGQLVTKEEAEENATKEWRWVFIAVAKDGDTAAGIADILDKYGFDDVAQQIRGKCVYFLQLPYMIPLKDTVVMHRITYYIYIIIIIIINIIIVL